MTWPTLCGHGAATGVQNILGLGFWFQGRSLNPTLKDHTFQLSRSHLPALRTATFQDSHPQEVQVMPTHRSLALHAETLVTTIDLSAPAWHHAWHMVGNATLVVANVLTCNKHSHMHTRQPHTVYYSPLNLRKCWRTQRWRQLTRSCMYLHADSKRLNAAC
jgi:hypothetical protein